MTEPRPVDSVPPKDDLQGSPARVVSLKAVATMQLGDVLGEESLPPQEVVKKLWQFFVERDLLQENKR